MPDALLRFGNVSIAICDNGPPAEEPPEDRNVTILLAVAAAPLVVAGSLALTLLIDAWVDDRFFDRNFGVDTSRKGWIAPLTQMLAAGRSDIGYMPTPVRSIRSIVSSLPIDYADYTFVDLGSGKGRALLVAAEFGFQRIVGVERSPHLNSIACGNIATFQNPAQRCRAIESLSMDARDFAPPSGPIVVFIFNAFERDVMQRIVDNLARSYDEDPRPVYLLYFHPRWNDVVASAACFRPFNPVGVLTDYFEIFEANPEPHSAPRKAA